MSANERIECVALVVLGFFGATIWYNFWVTPRDEIRFAIMDCMGDNHSEEAFHSCREQVVSAR